MKKFLSGLFLTIVPILSACEDVFVEDISDEEIVVINPLEGTTIQGSIVQFRWNALEDAESYRLQLLDEQQIIILDSSVVGSYYTQEIENGLYNWRIKGENSAYETVFTPLIGFSVE